MNLIIEIILFLNCSFESLVKRFSMNDLIMNNTINYNDSHRNYIHTSKYKY